MLLPVIGLGDKFTAECTVRSQLRQHPFLQHVIVVSPVGAHFVTSHDADPMESGLLVEPNRAFVGDGRVDREPVVAALLKLRSRN